MSTLSRESVIATEQKAVDRAYDCYEARFREMIDGSAARAAASGKDSITTKANAQAAADAYDLNGESLVVMRVDAVEPGAEGPVPWYIGRRTVLDVKTRDTVVVSWTSKMAVEWRKASQDAPGDVRLRRALMCDGRTVRDYRDEISLLPQKDAPAVPPQRKRSPTPGDVAKKATRRAKGKTEVDDFLLRVLNRSRSGNMRDIVETIQRDQLELVTNAPQGVLVIQGGPGTGKSAVGLHRVTWLVDNNHFRAEDILVVGPHRRFLEYVGRVLPTLGTVDVTAVELPLLWAGEARGTDSPLARRIKSDERMAIVLRRRVHGTCRPDAVDSFTTPAADERDEKEFVVTVEGRPVRVPRSEVIGLVEQARDTAGSYRQHRDRFRALLVDRLVSAAAGSSSRGSLDQAARARIERHRQVVSLVERTWPQLSPEEALRSLFDSANRLRECADGVLGEGEQDAIRRSRAKKIDEEPWTPDDLVLLEELRFLIASEIPATYRHIVLDEAQDLTPMQARSLARRCPKGSMTVLGDLAQATGPHTYGSWDRLARILAGKDGWHLAKLGTSYRVPQEVMDFVAPLATAVAPAVPFPIAVRGAGPEAVSLVPVEPWRLLDEAVTRASRLFGSDGERPRSIALVVPDGTGWQEEVRQRVQASDELDDRTRSTLSVVTTGQVKGMEFDHVIVLEPATVVSQGAAGLRSLYVALTRCTQSLTVLHCAPLPAVLIGDAGTSVSEGTMTGHRQCTRYRADGSHCGNHTTHPDGWCREVLCDGYRTAEPMPPKPWRPAPETPGHTDRQERLELSEADLRSLRISHRALDDFVSSHGGSPREAEYEMRETVADFLAEAHHSRRANGCWLLDHHGYRFELSPRGTTVTAYQTIHAERSHAQYKAGVPSRIKRNRMTVKDAESPALIEEQHTTVEHRSLPIGTEVMVRVLGRATERRWHAKALEPGTPARILLCLGPSTRAPEVGSKLTGWVFRHAAGADLVKVGDFGRKPISASMAPRYAAALAVFDELTGGAPPEDVKERLSELKGMANRCLRNDQADWLEVWRLLGEPTTERLTELRDLAQEARAAVVAEDRATVRRLVADFAASDWKRALADARSRLSYPDAEEGAVDDPPEKDIPENTIEENEHPMPQPSVPAQPVRSSTSESPAPSFLDELTASVASDRECHIHEALRFELRAALLRKGLRPTDSPLVDIHCGSPHGSLLFEVLGEGMVSYRHMRDGVLRLMEVRHASGAKADRLFLVLPEAPAEPWAVDTVASAFGVSMIWQSQEGWRGPEVNTALGSAVGAPTGKG
ncbi:HelD family protein [Streptomyces macrosporus]